MPLDDFDNLLQSFQKFTQKHSKIFFTFNLSKKKKKLGVKDFFYTFEEVELICKKNGFISDCFFYCRNLAHKKIGMECRRGKR